MNNDNRNDWQECKLGDIVKVVSGFAFKSEDFSHEGTPVIKINNIASGALSLNEVQCYPYEITDKLNQFILKNGDVLIALTGSHVHQPSSMVGRVTRYNLPYSALLNQRAGKVVVKSSDTTDKDFIFYFLTQKRVTIDLALNAGGSANQANISSEQLINLPVLLPPLPEQRAIAAVLYSLDDKIDLLNRQNKTLEGLAATLWRKMFIIDAAPNWKKGKLGDYGEFKNGINYSRHENGDANYSILNVRDIVESKYVNKSSFEIVSINQEKATSYLLKKRDIVIVRSASPGESLIVLEDVQNLIYSGFSIRLRCHDQSNSLFLFQFLQSYKKEMDIFSDGTTLKNINQEILNSIELVVPDKEIVEKFNSRVTSVFSKILINQEQIRTLSTLRDSLLPRLMSGEVRVKV